jgi:DNA repair protein RadD
VEPQAVKLRPYQAEALTALQHELLQPDCPSLLLEAATGAGKSLIIAELAKWINSVSRGGRVLCIAPSAELVKQNLAKYAATGNRASLYSASAGEKCIRHPVVFATPITLRNGIDRFSDRISAIVIDEAHGTTNSIREIVEIVRERNMRCRVVGLSATPYRTGEGLIFARWPDGKPVRADEAKRPYFGKLVYKIGAWDLIHQGYLTPPAVGVAATSYDTSGLQMDTTGRFTAESVDRAFVGKGRLTSAIIADVVANAINRRGVMLFCATIAHAHEALESLPPSLSAIVTGETPRAERERILHQFKRGDVKYLVNVAVLTTGFDAPHVDLIAILRATESPGLLQQIIGRGLRLYEGKVDCLVLDYAENIKRHCPDGDVFAPTMRISRDPKGDRGRFVCPTCGGDNFFSYRENPGGFAINDDGYFVDLNGEPIQDEDGVRIPGHYGRRCQNYIDVRGISDAVQCGHRWESKECHECGTDNDIAARRCSKCKAELVNPNKKLKLNFAKMKKDPHQLQSDVVVSVSASEQVSMKGNPTLRLEWVTPWRKFTTFHTPKSRAMWARLFKGHAIGQIVSMMSDSPPETITYRKNRDSGFFDVLAFNRPADEEPA